MLKDQEHEIVKKCMNLALESLKIQLSEEEKEKLFKVCLEKGDSDAVKITKLVKKSIIGKNDLSIKKELLTCKMSGWMNYPIYSQKEGSVVSYVKRLKAVLAIDQITGNFKNYVLAKLDEKHMRVLENVKNDDMSIDEIIAVFEKMDDSTDSALLRLQHYEAEMTEESLTKLLDLFDRAHQNMSTVDKKHMMELKIRRVLEKYERNSHTWNKLFDHKERIQSNQDIISVLVPYWAFLKVNKNSKKVEKPEKFDKAKSGNQQQFSGKCHSCGIVGHRSKNCQVKKTEAVHDYQKKGNLNAKRVQDHDSLEEKIRKLTEENEKQKLMIQRMIDERQEDFACMRVQMNRENSSIESEELKKDVKPLKIREKMTGEEKGPVEFYLPVELERYGKGKVVQTEGLLDTGSSRSICPLKVALRLGFEKEQLECTSKETLMLANNGSWNTLGKIIVKLRITGVDVEVKTTFLVVDDREICDKYERYELILGSSTLSALKMSLDYDEKAVYVFNRRVFVMSNASGEKGKESSRRIASSQLGEELQMKLIDKYPSIIRVENEPLSECVVKIPALKVNVNENEMPVVARYNVPFRKKQIMDLQIKQWEKDGIVEKSEDILIQMNVLVVPKVNEVEKLVNEDRTLMNRNGTSVMMSNINLQDYRTCLDCRPVNKILAAPDPGKISKTLTFNQQKILLSKCKLFSKLDLASYYLQLSFDEPKEGELDSRRILGFLNPLTGESYRFKRLPFGLSCAPQYAQYVIDNIISAYWTPKLEFNNVVCSEDEFTKEKERMKKIMENDSELLSFLKKVGMHQSEVDDKLNERKLVEELEGSENYVKRSEKLDYNDHHGDELNFDGKLREKIDSLDVQNGNYVVVLPYQDDILIGTNDNVKYHCEVLDDIFQLLTKSRLCLNIKKCVFAVKQIQYLSIIIDADEGCKPAMKFVDPIMSYERPKSSKSVRRFLGLVQYLRPWIKEFAKNTMELTSLLRKDRRFTWTQTCEKEFLKVKEMIRDISYLKLPVANKEYYLMTDASQGAEGGTLFQFCDVVKKLRPVAYYSKKTSYGKSVPPLMIELRALVHAVRHFSDIIECSRTLVLTDHLNLVRIWNGSSHEYSYLFKYLMALAEYPLSIHFVPGVAQIFSDALSRQYALRITGEEQDNLMEKSQRMLLPVKLENPDEDTKRKWFDAFHTNFGHASYSRSYPLLRRRVGWKGISKHYKMFLEKCVSCSNAEDPKDGKVFMSAKPVDEPMVKVMWDLLGPLSGDENGFKYAVVGIDLCTKYGFIEFSKTCMADEVKQCIERACIYPFGCARTFMSDGAHYFMKVGKLLKDDYGCNWEIGVAHQHRHQSDVERFLLTIQKSARKLITDVYTQSIWPEVLRKIVYYYNNVPHSTTTSTPHMLFFGWEIYHKIDVDENMDVSYIMDSNRNEAIRQMAWKINRDVVAVTRNKLIQNENASAHQPSRAERLVAGAKVMVKQHNFKDKMMKFTPTWESGFIIKGKDDERNIYFVSKVNATSGRFRKVGLDQIKLDPNQN